MAMQTYTTKASRNLIRAEAEMLKDVDEIIVLGKFGQQKEQPLNKTDTVVFRRVMAYGGTAQTNPADGYSETMDFTAASHVAAEGVTPPADTITYVDVSTTLQQYVALYKFSSKVALTYEDDIPADMRKQCSKRLAAVSELIDYGQVRAGTAVVYSNGSSRSAVNTPLTLNTLRRAARALNRNQADLVSDMVDSGANFATYPVEPAFVCFIHTDMEPDVRRIEGFVHKVSYGGVYKPLHPREFGAVENFRFISSPYFKPFLAAGATVTGTGLLSAGAANVDVYPSIVMGADAFGCVSLKGHGVSGINPTIIPANQKNHANPAGMFGYVGADFWKSTVRLNENFMVRIESGAAELTD